MPRFLYEARTRAGRAVRGLLESEGHDSAITELHRQELAVTRIEEVERLRVKRSFLRRAPKPSPSELSLFTRQLATMVAQGMPVAETVEFLSEQRDTPAVARVCESLAHQLRQGCSLSEAMADQPRAFPQLYVAMVRAGEASGNMDLILVRLAEHLEASQSLRRDVLAALTYPLVSTLLVLGGSAFLVLGVLPAFGDVFAEMGATLPRLTAYVLATAKTLEHNALAIGVVAGACVVTLVVLCKLPRGKRLLDRVLMRTPVVGSLAHRIALSRTSRTFATLLHSGVPLLATLDLVADTAGNSLVADAVRNARVTLGDGGRLSDGLDHGRAFPPMVLRMVRVGETVGAIEALLERVADYYEAQVRATMKSLTSLIEPALISVLGGILGVVVLSIVLAMLQLMQSV